MWVQNIPYGGEEEREREKEKRKFITNTHDNV